MYILDHAVAPWFLEVTGSREILYFLLPQYLPWHPATPPTANTGNILAFAAISVFQDASSTMCTGLLPL